MNQQALTFSYPSVCNRIHQELKMKYTHLFFIIFFYLYNNKGLAQVAIQSNRPHVERERNEWARKMLLQSQDALRIEKECKFGIVSKAIRNGNDGEIEHAILEVGKINSALSVGV